MGRGLGARSFPALYNFLIHFPVLYFFSVEFFWADRNRLILIGYSQLQLELCFVYFDRRGMP